MPAHDSPSSLVVFLGPSLDRSSAETLVPGSIFLPPIGQGQLASAVARYQPTHVAMIDGEFGQCLSVWHKEILHVLGKGVRVFGASSMGALRAAECEVYGMEGFGRIYEWYRDGLLTDDDEVALLHGPADTGWRTFSWPMVNVRATLERLETEQRIDAATAAHIAAATKALYFGSRTESAVTQALVDGGRSDGAALARLLTDHYVDQKRLDAEGLLSFLADGGGTAPGEQRRPRERLGWLGSTLLDCDTEVSRRAGCVLRHQIIDDAAIHEPDFEELQIRALHRRLVAAYAVELGYDPSSAELDEERRRFLARRALTEESLPDWLDANDIDAAHLEALLVEEAQTRRLRRWYLGTRGYERNRRVVADQLRLEGRYPDVADRAARRATLAADTPSRMPRTDEETARLVSEHMVLTGWRPSPPLTEWAEDHGFGSVADLLVALADAAAGRREAATREQRVRGALAAMMESPGD